ncbi:MAG: acyl-CoA desaturase [candidate division Zixibacteria bacterium HGW-Zixibacteria-1]|nr:MAG: acyl-CoA desaturase [candidate division Zixibacteria bacterium HGW-Zixibacteria-1]
MAAILIFFFAHWFLSLFFHSFFLHRYGSHQMFTMSRRWEKFFLVMTFITQGSTFLDPRAYALMHRMHHAYSDTERDPHSPGNFKNVLSMMLSTAGTYRGIISGKITVPEEFQGNIPQWEAFGKIAHLRVVGLIFVGLYIAFYVHFAPSPWFYLLLPIHVLMGPIQGAIVNWCGHKYGYTRYKNLGDNSRNTFPIDIFLLGELYQNNHHKRPLSPNLAHRWYEFDPSYPVIWLMNRLGIIHFRPDLARVT